MRTYCKAFAVMVMCSCVPPSAAGFGVLGEDVNGIAARWDAAPRTVSGNERSLDGGLRYSVEGGSYLSYRDLFSWSSTPTVAAFQAAVENAFDVWTADDPTTGLGTSLSFVDEVGITTVATNASLGAEIDLFAGPSLGSGVTGGVATVGWQIWGADVVTMTTGDVRGRNVISGADIVMNDDGATWTLGLFEQVLTHEIGHALGLADVEIVGAAGDFIDDNYDGTTASLQNSFALLIDTSHPESSAGLSKFTVPTALFDADDGTTGAPFLLMETNGDPGGSGALGNDTYAGRQYLYPSAVPEPKAWLLMIAAATVGGVSFRRKQFVSERNAPANSALLAESSS